MIKNYIYVALRNLLKHKFYSTINILGLSVGLTCFLLISLFVVDELSYDKFHRDIENTYRLDFEGAINGSEFITSLSSVPAAAVLLEEYPEVVETVRVRESGNWLIKRKGTEDNYYQEEVAFIDPNFFEFFDFKLLKGDVKECLTRPKTLVLNETEATKLFGNEDPIGKMVVIDNEEDWEVTGVYEDMPANSHMNFSMMFTMESREEAKSKFWMSFNFVTYLRLQKGFDPARLEGKFPDLIVKYIGPEIEQYMGASMEEFYQAGNKAGFSLFPMQDIHLYSDKDGDLMANGDIKYVYVFTAIALFILILACINFMNLSTARSASRAKEVGIRKTMGAYKSQLIKQFLSEAFLLTFISIILAYLMAALALNSFNVLANKAIALEALLSPSFALIMLGVLILVGLLAGSYPAFFLSNFKPVEVLKGKLNLGLKSGGLRSTLVVIQFSVSIIMIIGTTIVFQQLSYIQNKKLGFTKDQVVMIHDPWIMGDRAKSYKNEVLQSTLIKSGTLASFLPVDTQSDNNLWFPGSTPTKDESYVFYNARVDHDYLTTLDMEIAEGRFFSKDFPSDSMSIVVNEALVKHLGWDTGVGKKLSTYGGSQEEPTVEVYNIVGVVKDFHYKSLKDKIEPLLFELGEDRGFVSFKIDGGNVSESLDFIRSKWDEFAPGQPFQYSFMDDRFNDLYKSEQKLGQIFGVFAFLAIFIACLGLYGLAAFTAEQRKKEIGVRKVLGASIASIIALLSKEFLKLVGIAIIFATPISYYFMYKWLEDFENRTSINFMVFIFAGLLALIIAWMTMSYQSWSAARVNPAKSLKDE